MTPTDDVTGASYRDAALPLVDRVEDLLARMTLDEKLAQLGCVWSTQLMTDEAFSDAAAQRLLANGTGHVTPVAASAGLRPHGLAEFHNTIMTASCRCAPPSLRSL